MYICIAIYLHTNIRTHTYKHHVHNIQEYVRYIIWSERNVSAPHSWNFLFTFDGCSTRSSQRLRCRLGPMPTASTHRNDYRRVGSWGFRDSPYRLLLHFWALTAFTFRISYILFPSISIPEIFAVSK